MKSTTTVAPKPKTITDPKEIERQEMGRAATRILAQGGTKQEVAEYWHKGYGVTLPGYTPPTETPGMTRGLSMNALQGLTFGFGDEGMGAMLGLLTGKGAGAGIDEYRAELESFNNEHSVAGFASEVAGGALPMMAGPGAALAKQGGKMGPMGRLGFASALGGGAGALYGAGNAEGGFDVQGISERAKGAVLGGALGLVVGAPTALAIQGVGAVATPVVRRTVLNWVDKLKSTPKDATTASKAARSIMAEAMVRDHGTIDKAIDAAKKLPLDAPAAVADVGGENVLGLVQAASGLRGPGKQKMMENFLTRQADQGDRMLGQFFRMSKVGAENAYDAADDVFAKRQQFATPLYEAAFGKETAVTPELKKLLDHPRFQKAYDYGRLIAQDEDLAGTASKGALRINPLSFDEKTGKVTNATIPIRALDYMKRGLDTMIDGGMGGDPIERQFARSHRQLLNDALDAVDDVPEYKKARNVWRGGSEMLEALQLGKGGEATYRGAAPSQRFHLKPPELIARELKNLSPAEAEAYRIGAAQDMAEYLNASTAQAPNAAKKLGGREFGTAMSNIEKRVRALFDDPTAAEEFMDYVKAEARLSRTAGVLGGSRTAPMAEAMAELTGGGGKGSVIRQAADATITPLTNRAKTGWTDAISDALSDLALRGTNGRAELIAALEGMRPHAPKFRQAIPAVVAGQQGAQAR